jgi:hypothetical protein
MQELHQKSGQYFKTLKIMHFAMLVGQVLFLFISIFLINVNGPFVVNDKELSGIFKFVVPFFAIAGLITSNFIYKSRLASIKIQSFLVKKINDYRAALILRYALLEGPSLLAIIVYLIFGDILFLSTAVLIMLYFLVIRPTTEKALEHLELNSEDARIMNDLNRVIL